MTTVSVAPRRISVSRSVRHSLSLAARSMLKIKKNPETLVDVVFQPILMLLMFTYLFGGAIGGGNREDYLQLLLPGLMAQTTLFACLGTGVSLNTDITRGVFDRFRSLPIARSAPLVGAVFGDVVRFVVSAVILLLFGMVFGFRVHTDPLSVLALLLVMVAFGVSFCWISTLVGMLVKSPQAVPGVLVAFILPLGFGSNVFAPTSTMPDWLRAWADVNPVSLLTEVGRGLLLGGPVGGPLLGTLAWMLGIVAVFFPLAMRAYRRRVG